MEKIIDGLNLYIRKILYKTQTELNSTPYLKILCNEVKKCLATYDSEVWKGHNLDFELQYFLEALEESPDDYELILTMFVIYNKKLDIIADYDIEYIYFIASAFIVEEVSISMYDSMLSMFLNPSISFLLQSLDENVQILLISYLILSIPYEDIEKGMYNSAIRDLSLFIGVSLSSQLFLHDIYMSMRSIMFDDKYKMFFNHGDVQKLNLILELDEALSQDLKEKFIMKLTEIEESYKYEKVLAIKKMLKCSLEYWAFAVRGIGVIKSQEKEPHKKEK